MNQNLGTSKRIAKNTMMLYIRLMVSMIVGFFSSRIILQALGTVDYGVYSLVGGIVVLFSFLNSALSTATQRFLTIQVGKNDEKTFHHVFRVSVTTHLLIAILIFILVEIIGFYLLNHKLSIPEDRLQAANIVLHFSTLTFLVQVIQIPFNAAIIAHERMSFYAWLSIVEVLLKLAVAVLLLYVLQDRLIIYSILLLFTAIIVFSVYIIYDKKEFCLKTKLCWDRTLTWEMLSFSGWRLLGGGSRIVEQQGYNFALNLYSGIVANAAIGIANQVSSIVNSFVTNFQVAFNPQITKYYATGEYNEMFTLSYRTSKFSFCLLFLLCLPLIGDIDYYLVLWLKTPPEMADSFSTVILINMLIEALSAPLWMMIIANGKIAKYQIYLSSFIIIGTAISIFLLSIGIRADVAMCGRVLASISILIMRLILLRNMLQFSISEFVKGVIVPISIISFIGSGELCIIKTLKLHPLLNTVIIVLLTSVLMWIIALNNNERKIIKDYCLGKITKH